MANNLSLLSTTNRVEVPVIQVKIGDYTFGVAEKKITKISGTYTTKDTRYPNYINSLTVTKISGKVNTYSLSLAYPVVAGADPNYFEKVFSSVSKSRKIWFTYGDMNAPQFVYRNEEAIITDVTQQLSFSSSVISYQVTAVSSGNLLAAGAYNFRARTAKPSSVLKEILANKTYGVQDIFYGMRDLDLVAQRNLIRSDDCVVDIKAKTNISVLDYITYLVSCMTKSPLAGNGDDVYVFTVVDDTTGVFGGPYFKVDLISKTFDSVDTYEIDAGYPGGNIVTDLQIQNNESYSIFYDYQTQLNTAEYRQTIDDQGNLVDQYAPIISSRNNQFQTTPSDETWWRKVTEYPITLTLSLRGLLRPAILMTNVRLKVYYYGQLHSSSGKYIVTKQVDKISFSGFETQLTLVRVGADQ